MPINFIITDIHLFAYVCIFKQMLFIVIKLICRCIWLSYIHMTMCVHFSTSILFVWYLFKSSHFTFIIVTYFSLSFVGIVLFNFTFQINLTIQLAVYDIQLIFISLSLLFIKLFSWLLNLFITCLPHPFPSTPLHQNDERSLNAIWHPAWISLQLHSIFLDFVFY